MEYRYGARDLADGVVTLGRREQPAQSTVARLPAHHDEMIRDGAVLHYLAHAEVHIGREAPVELDLAATRSCSSFFRGVVEETRAQGLEKLVGPIPGEEDRRDVRLRDRGVGISHKKPPTWNAHSPRASCRPYGFLSRQS